MFLYLVYLVSYLRYCRVQPADQRGPLHALRGQQSQELPLAAQLQRRGGAHTLQLGLVPQAVQRWVHIYMITLHSTVTTVSVAIKDGCYSVTADD